MERFNTDPEKAVGSDDDEHTNQVNFVDIDDEVE